MTRPQSTRRSVPIMLVACLTLVACGTATPTAAPTQPTPTATAPIPTSTPRPAGEVYAEIRAAVEAIRGLKPTAAVDPVTINETQLRTNLEAEFDATNTPAKLKNSEDLLITLGLLPKGASLRALTSDLQGGQVAGYYSPDKDQLYIVNRSGSLGPADEVTYSHEFTHQLQDQNFHLDALDLDAADQSDRSFARLALVEGDATSVQSSWMIANLDSKELGELLGAALDPEALAALQRAPAYLRDTVQFEYQDGFGFVTRILLNGGGYPAVDAVFADPPASTEQILHPDKYLVREAPIAVTLPKVLFDGLVGTEWSELSQDTLGELILRIWLNEGGVSTAVARTASAGWGGDRVSLLRGPAGARGLVLRSEWDTPVDADEFAAAASTVVAKVAPGGQVVHEPGSKTIWVAIGPGAVTVVTVATAGA